MTAPVHKGEPMSTKQLATTSVILVSLIAACLAIAAGSADAQTAVTAIDRGEQIEALRAMEPSQRRAELKKMDPSERRGLWMELKGAERQDSVARATGLYSSMTPQTVTAQPSASWASRAVGTIAYDNGFPSTGFAGGALVGNHFDTHTGIPVINPGTISTIQAVVVPGPSQTGSSAGFVIHGPQTTGGGAMALFSSFTAASGVIDTVSFAGLGVTYTGSSFFVLFGDFASSYIPVFGTETALGQGHHGVVGYTGGQGPNITGTFNFGGTLNAFVRATGNIVPVELMSFDAS